MVRKVLEKNVDLGEVQFTRHEPTLSRHLVTWIQWARDLGYQTVSLITNGRRLGKDNFAKRLVEAGLNKVEISLHGHQAGLQDRITQRKGSYTETVAGIESIVRIRRDQDLAFKLHSTVVALNVDFLPEMVEHFLAWEPDSYGLNAVFLTGGAVRNRDQVAVPYPKMVESFRQCILTGVHRPVTLSEVPHCQMHGLVPEEYIGFREDFHHVRVDVDGRVAFHEALSSPRGFMYRKECQQCVLLSVCDGVPEAYIELYGWKGFDPIGCSDMPRFEEKFENEENLRALFCSPSNEWRIDAVEVGHDSALFHIQAVSPPDRLIRLWVTPRREHEPAFGRSRRFNIALRGEGYTQDECTLAEKVVELVSVRDSEKETS
jgi:hypothetical protein